MTHDQLLEATAKAIYAARFEHLPPRWVTKWEKLPDDAKEVWRRCARAALAVAIEACAKVAEQQRPMVDCQGIMRLGFLQGGMEIASAIRTLLPPEPTP